MLSQDRPRLTACAVCVHACAVCVHASWRFCARAILCACAGASGVLVLRSSIHSACACTVPNSVMILPCGPQIASGPGLSDRYDSGELAGTNRVIDWIGASGSPESMDDHNSPATPRPASSFIASSLHGAGDCLEFDLLQTIRRLEKEKEEERREKERALAENEILRSQNRGLAVAAEESARTASVQSVQLKAASAQSVKLAASSERRRLCNRAMAARLRRMCTEKKREVPKRFTRVRPDQISGSALEQFAGESVVMSTTSLAAESDPKRGKGQPRQWGYSKKASDHVMVKLPGAFMKRGAHLPGIIANPRRLLAKVMVWSDFGHISIEAVARAFA